MIAPRELATMSFVELKKKTFFGNWHWQDQVALLLPNVLLG
jgi:hypothetical protein